MLEIMTACNTACPVMHNYDSNNIKLKIKPADCTVSTGVNYLQYTSRRGINLTSATCWITV